MRQLVSVLIAAIAFGWFGSSQTQAANQNLALGIPMSGLTEGTDGDIDTFFDMQAVGKNPVELVFPEEYEIVSISVTGKFPRNGSYLRVWDATGKSNYYNSSWSSGAGQEGVKRTATANFSTPLKAKRIELIYNTVVYEFEVYGIPDTTPPAKPSGLAATAGDKKVILSWAKNTETDVAKYRVYQNGLKLAEVNVPTLTYTAINLINGTDYRFSITAIDRSGNESVKSNELTIAPIGPPDKPIGLNAVAGEKEVRLSWTANTGPPVTGYNLYRDDVKVNTTPIKETTYKDTGRTNGVTYTYQVSAVGLSGDESVKSDPVTAQPQGIPPAAPQGLTAAAGDSVVTLTWKANTEPDMFGFNLYRDGVKVNAAPIRTLGYTDNDVTNNTVYKYRLTAVDTDGNESEKSAEVQAMPVLDNTPPAVPTGLTAAPGNQLVSLSWKANTESDLAGYNLFRNGVKVNKTPLKVTTYKDSGRTNGVTYHYRISAVDNSGNESEQSDPVSATPGLIPILKAYAGDGKVTLVWDAIPDATEYRIYRDNEVLTTVTGTQYTDLSVTNKTRYTYRVAAIIENGEGLPSAPVAITPGIYTEFPPDGGGGNGLGSLPDVIQTGLNFAGKFWGYIVVVLAILFGPTLISIPYWLMNRLRPKERREKGKQAEAKKREPLTPEEKERRAKERKLNRARDDKYDYLTRLGRIKERDAWVKSTEYLTREQRVQRAREERNRKAREQRAAAKAGTAGRQQRQTRKGRSGRNGR